MSIASNIQQLIESYGITRLCHFAPLRNVHHILSCGAILCSERVEEENPSGYHPTDDLRLDQCRTHVCANIEYPNIWYLEKVEASDDVYIDYAVFLLRPEVMAAEGTLFCVRNAAGSGANPKPGPDGLRAMFAQTVAGKQTWKRLSNHPKWLPTDMQAEVLLPDAVSFDEITGVVVKSKDVAARFVAQLHAAKTQLSFPILVSPGVFSRTQLAALRTGGKRPREELFGG